MSDRDDFSEIEAKLDAIVSRKFARAMELADRYWHDKWDRNKSREPENRSNFGPLVRMVGRSLSISWTRNEFNRKHPNKPYRTWIKKGRAVGYSESVLRRHAKDWELELCIETEEEFTRIRRAVAGVGKIRRLLATLRRDCEFPPAELDGVPTNDDARIHPAQGEAQGAARPVKKSTVRT